MRYASRPAMAQSRITDFDSDTHMVTWFYDRHEDGKRITVTEHARDFLKKLILHIPDDHFPMVRYYGFYNNRKQPTLNHIYQLMDPTHSKKHNSLKERKALAKRKMNKFKYRTFVRDSYNRDVLLCSCGHIMVYTDSYNPLEGKHNDRQYRENSINEMHKMWLRGRRTRMGT